MSFHQFRNSRAGTSFEGARAARGLIGTFPFVSSADRSVALAAMLTSLDRRSMATAPLFAFNSPAAGTGKSKLVDLCSILATGEKIAVITQGEKEEELVKSLSSALLAGISGSRSTIASAS